MTLLFSDDYRQLAWDALLIKGWAGSNYTSGVSGTGGKIYTTDSLLSYQLDRMRFVNPSNSSENFYSVQLASFHLG